MIDTHAHLSGLRQKGVDPHEILQKLFAENFHGIIDISLEPGDLQKRVEEFSVYDRVFFASGLWPWSATIAGRNTLVGQLERDISSTKNVCALGEFGLDHNWNGPDKSGESGGSTDLKGERELMEMQMDLAARLNLPVIIHSRDAAAETAEILKAYPHVRGVVHCFSYGPEEAKIFLDLGYFISFAGNLTYKNAHTIQDACGFVPGDSLILETDCPYLAPVPHRGKPAHPGMVEEIYKKAAEIRRTDKEILAGLIQENVKRLFGF